jgi:hypothetical protein
MEELNFKEIVHREGNFCGKKDLIKLSGFISCLHDSPHGSTHLSGTQANTGKAIFNTWL